MSNFDDEYQYLHELEQPIDENFLSILYLDFQLENEFFDFHSFSRIDSIYEFNDNSQSSSLRRFSPRRNSRFAREHPQNIQKYLQKRNIPIQNYQFNPRHPHIKITQLRNMNISRHYLINEYGLLDSQKNTNSKDIIIGRQYRQNKDIIPNDIILLEDRAISRIHCKIVCNDYFRKKQFLDPFYTKVLEKINLPSFFKFRISQFLEKPKIIYIQDLGSVCGTYLRIFNQKPHLLQENEKFIIGSETSFNIVFNHKLDPKLKQIDDEWYSIIKYLSTLKLTQKHEIHLNDDENLKNLQEPFVKIKSLQVIDLYKKLSEYQLPILIVQFQGQGVIMNKSINLFVGKTQTDTNDIFVGRGVENRIWINSNTISRKQCRIKYSQKYQSWIINDGLYDRESANGTWISLQTNQQSEQTQESNLIEIHHNDEIRINDYIFKLELFKGTKEGVGHIINEFLHE